ncbi:unnamed protein product [Urochloa humidicola]
MRSAPRLPRRRPWCPSVLRHRRLLRRLFARSAAPTRPPHESTGTTTAAARIDRHHSSVHGSASIPTPPCALAISLFSVSPGAAAALAPAAGRRSRSAGRLATSPALDRRRANRIPPPVPRKVSASRNKKSNFSANEDTLLCNSWLEISCDPITNTARRRREEEQGCRQSC